MIFSSSKKKSSSHCAAAGALEVDFNVLRICGVRSEWNEKTRERVFLFGKNQYCELRVENN
jgi:hypothetical protein